MTDDEMIRLQGAVVNQMLGMFQEKMNRNFLELVTTFNRQQEVLDSMDDEKDHENKVRVNVSFLVKRNGEIDWTVFAPEMQWKMSVQHRDKDVWYVDVNPNQLELPFDDMPKREWLPMDAVKGTLEWLEWGLLYKVAENVGKDIYFFPKVTKAGEVYKWSRGHWQSFHAPNCGEVADMAVEHEGIVLVPDGLGMMQMTVGSQNMLNDEGVKTVYDVSKLGVSEKEAMDGKVCVIIGYLPRKQ